MTDTITNMFAAEDEWSPVYRWRHGRKRIKFIIYSITRPSAIADAPPAFDKWVKDDENENPRDVDYLYLKHHIINSYPDADVELQQNITLNELWRSLEDMKNDVSLAPFDCYFFVFLTFLSVNGVTNQNGTIHFQDAKVELDKVWDKVGEIKAMINCPKVFLVQADDIKMLQRPPMFTKSPDSFNVVQRKIPTEADRITIFSCIPSRNFVQNGTPSFLIQAFVDVLSKNKNKPRDQQLDFLSLTVLINDTVRILIERSELTTTEQKQTLPVPQTTSTLKKLLDL